MNEIVGNTLMCYFGLSLLVSMFFADTILSFPRRFYVYHIPLFIITLPIIIIWKISGLTIKLLEIRIR